MTSMDKYTFIRMIESQALIEMGVNRIVKGTKEEDSEIIESIVDANNDQWEEIVEFMYQKYPEIRGRVNIMDLISDLLDTVQIDSGVEHWDKQDLQKFAGVIGKITVDYCSALDAVLFGVRMKQEMKELGIREVTE